jgi:hypothetical protein
MAAPGFGAGFAAAGGAPPPALAIPLRGPRPRIAAGLPGGGAGLPLGPRGGMGPLRVGRNGFIYKRNKSNTNVPNTLPLWMGSEEIGIDFDTTITQLADFDKDTIYIKVQKEDYRRRYPWRGVIGYVEPDFSVGALYNLYFKPAYTFDTDGDLLKAINYLDHTYINLRFDPTRENYHPVRAEDLGVIADVIRRINYESITDPVNAATARRLAQPVPPAPVVPVNFGRFALPAGPQVNVKGEYGPASRRRSNKRKSRKSRKN